MLQKKEGKKKQVEGQKVVERVGLKMLYESFMESNIKFKDVTPSKGFKSWE